MHYYLITAALCSGLAAGEAAGPLQGGLKAKGWFTSYATARAEAMRTGKPLMVVFRCEP
jgi:hypothetical protein